MFILFSHIPSFLLTPIVFYLPYLQSSHNSIHALFPSLYLRLSSKIYYIPLLIFFPFHSDTPPIRSSFLLFHSSILSFSFQLDYSIILFQHKKRRFPLHFFLFLLLIYYSIFSIVLSYFIVFSFHLSKN